MKINPGICNRCGQYATNLNNCLCREFFVWGDWLDDAEGDTIHAHDSQDAAEKYAEQYDQGGDYPIINAGGDNVKVREIRTGEEFQFYVEAWSKPTYSASLIDPKSK